MSYPLFSARKKKWLVFTLIGFVILAIGLLALIVVLADNKSNNTANKDSTQDSTTEIIKYSTDTPSTERPGKDFIWKGKPNEPKKILIPDIDVDAYIQKVGVDQRDEVAVPNNLYMAGWFVDTAKPGHTGLSLIVGHVSGRNSSAVFENLHKLNKGDQFIVELGNGTKVNYEVFDKENAKVQDSVSIMFSQDPTIKHQLNLVTCSGNRDPITRSRENRLTVKAKQIDPDQTT